MSAKKQQRQLRKSIEKKITSKKMKKKQYRFLTGSTLLDVLVGGGLGKGYPSGKIINLVGDKSSGKTFLACELVASAYYKYGDKVKWVYDDAESGFTFDTKGLYGFEIVPLNEDDRKRSDTVEDLYGNMREFSDSLSEDDVGIYIIDSLDGLSSKEMADRGDERYKAHKKGEGFDKGSYQTQKQKFLSQEFFPKLAGVAEDKNILIVIISQIRENIGGGLFSKKFKRSGGKALDFYAHTCLWLYPVQKTEKKGRPVGVVIKAISDKSKTPRPYRSCFFNLVFDYGLDNIGTNIDFLFNLRTDTGKLKGNSEIRWDEKEKITVKSIKDFLIDHNMLETYQKEVKKMINKEMAIDWIMKSESLAQDFSDKFGSDSEVMDRGQLISYIEENNLEAELDKRVEDKWEEIETSIQSNRKPKYG